MIKVLLLLFLLQHVYHIVAIHTLDYEQCGKVLFSGKVLYQCDYLRFGDTVNLHDLTGHNQITIMPDTFYINHGKTIGYSGHHALYIEKEQLSKREWEEFKTVADTFEHANTAIKISDSEIYDLSDKSEKEIDQWIREKEKIIKSHSGLDRNNRNI